MTDEKGSQEYSPSISTKTLFVSISKWWRIPSFSVSDVIFTLIWFIKEIITKKENVSKTSKICRSNVFINVRRMFYSLKKLKRQLHFLFQMFEKYLERLSKEEFEEMYSFESFLSMCNFVDTGIQELLKQFFKC